MRRGKERKRGCVEEDAPASEDVDVSIAEMEFEIETKGKEDVKQDEFEANFEFVRRDGANIPEKYCCRNHNTKKCTNQPNIMNQQRCLLLLLLI